MASKHHRWKEACEEMAWVIGKLITAHNDRNPNRAAQLDKLLKYGNEVLIAARSKEELPKRPDVASMI